MNRTEDTEPVAPPGPDDCGLVLDVLGAQVGETARLIERSVAQVCQSFASIARRTKQAATNTRQVLGHSSGDATAAARDTIAGLLARMEHVRRITDKAAEHVGHIERLATQVSRVRERIEEVDAVAFSLNILALNARIEAARAGDRGRAFGIVAGETEEVSKAIRIAARSVRELVDALLTDVTTNARLVQNAFLDDRLAADLGHEQGERALEALTRAHAEMTGLVAATAADSARLADDIAEAITALQFQDAVNQQLDHVVGALADVRAALPGGGSADALADRVRARSTMHSERAILDRLTDRTDGPSADPAAGSVELF